jgi:hypothetical protein
MLRFTIQGIVSPTSSSLAEPDAADWVLGGKVGGIRCELAIGDGWGALSRRYVRDGSLSGLRMVNAARRIQLSKGRPDEHAYRFQMRDTPRFQTG